MKFWRWNRLASRHGWPLIGYESRNGGMTWLVIGRSVKNWRLIPAPWEDVPNI